MEKRFYVYQWFDKNNDFIFYVGKGCGLRFKNVQKRNKLFLDYYSTHDCDVCIIKDSLTEQEAFELEKNTILYYKNIGQCTCNLDNGGTGGTAFIWTEEMKQYFSQFNPMKEASQKERMSQHNPMYNKETVEKVSQKKSKVICYKGKEWTSQKLVETYGICITTAQRWAKRGYDTNGEPCFYKNETSPTTKKTTCSKGVLIDGQYYPSLRAACDFLGVKDTSPLCKALKANKPYKGHKCEYANQQPSNVNSNNSNIEGSTTNE